MADEHDDGYTGPATLTVDGRAMAVRVILDARHEPVDGRLHWFGRLIPGNDVEEGLLGSATGPVELSTAGGSAQARIGEVDPWGRYRVTGVGTPPFTIPAPDLDDPALDD